MAFGNARTVSELALTPIGWTLTESRNELVFRHCLKTITTRIVRKLNPWDTKYIRNNLQCENYAHTSNASNEMRYWIIESMHVEVKLLDQHRWTSDRGITQWPLSYTIDDSGKVGVKEVRQVDLAFRMNASSRKFSKKSNLAFSSQNRKEKGVVSAEKDAPKRIGFRHGADLRLGAIKADQRKRRKGEREREREKTIRKVPKQFKIYQRIYWKERTYAWECMNMWHAI